MEPRLDFASYGKQFTLLKVLKNNFARKKCREQGAACYFSFLNTDRKNKG